MQIQGRGLQWCLCVLYVIHCETDYMSLTSPTGHWGLSAPNSTTVSFTEHNDLAKFYTVAAEVGVYVIVRPGYVSAFYFQPKFDIQ